MRSSSSDAEARAIVRMEQRARLFGELREQRAVAREASLEEQDAAREERQAITRGRAFRRRLGRRERGAPQRTLGRPGLSAPASKAPQLESR